MAYRSWVVCPSTVHQVRLKFLRLGVRAGPAGSLTFDMSGPWRPQAGAGPLVGRVSEVIGPMPKIARKSLKNCHVESEI